MLAKLENILLFLTILLLPTQLGKHFWPQFSFVYSLPIDYLSPIIYFWDLLILFLMIVWLSSRPKINKLALNLLLIFILTQAAALLGAENIGAGLVRLEQYLIAGSFGIYLASSDWKLLSARIQLPLVVAIFFESGLAIAQFIKGGTIGLWILGERSFSISTPAIAKFDFYGREFLRPYATFPHPNVLAAFMVIGSLLIKNRIIRFLAGFATLLTFSRTAILAGVIAAFLLLNKKGRAVLIMGIIILLPILYTRYVSLLNFDNLTLLRREELSATALSIWQSAPFLGVGLNNFIPVSAVELVQGPSRFLQPVHNIFLLSLAETGVLGLLGLLGLLGYPLFKLFRLYPKPYPLNPMLLIWGVIILLGLFDHYFLTLPQGYRLLFLVWGLSFSMLELKS